MCRHGSRGIPDVLQQSQFTHAAPMQYAAVIFSALSKPARPAPVMEYISPAPAVSYVSPAPAVEYINPALAVSHASPALTVYAAVVVDISLQLQP